MKPRIEFRDIDVNAKEKRIRVTLFINEIVERDMIIFFIIKVLEEIGFSDVSFVKEE